MNCGIACKELDTVCLLALFSVLYTRYHSTQQGQIVLKQRQKYSRRKVYELWDRVQGT